MSDEETRALQYRTDQQTGERAMYVRWRALAGSASAYATRLTETEALKRDTGWDPSPLLSDDEKDLVN